MYRVNQGIMEAIFEQWAESENYHRKSALENGTYKKYIERMGEVIGEREYTRISDDITYLACEAEIAGFNSGFLYGVMFMSDMLG